MVKQLTVNKLRYNSLTKQVAQYLLKIGSKSDYLRHSLYCGNLQNTPPITTYLNRFSNCRLTRLRLIDSGRYPPPNQVNVSCRSG